MSAETLLLGIDVGGTKTAVVVGNLDGTVRERAEFPSLAGRGPDLLIDDIEREAATLLRRHSGVAGVGVSIGGPVDAEAGLVMSPPNLPGWDAIPLASALARRLGLPARIEHDAKAGALAEWRYGAGRGTRDMVFLTLGTGIGAGIIANGRLVRGAGNLAGELGHWRIAPDGPELYGKRGSLEGWASGAGLPSVARFLRPTELGDIADAVALSRRAEAGDAVAAEVIAASGAALGRALALLVDLLAPERIVLGNLARRLGPTFSDAAAAELAKEALPALADRCRVIPCELGDAIGDMAALAVAAEAIAERTSDHAAQ